MGTYLLFVMVAFVIIYLFYAVIHPEPPQSSSASRFTAGAAGFLILSQ